LAQWEQELAAGKQGQVSSTVPEKKEEVKDKMEEVPQGKRVTFFGSEETVGTSKYDEEDEELMEEEEEEEEVEDNEESEENAATGTGTPDAPSDKENHDDVVESDPLPSLPLIKRHGLDTEHLSASPVSRRTRLSALARTINEWEDDLTHSPLVGKIIPQQQQKNQKIVGKHSLPGDGSPRKSVGGGGSPMRFIQPQNTTAGGNNWSSPNNKGPAPPPPSNVTPKGQQQSQRGSSPAKNMQPESRKSVSPTKPIGAASLTPSKVVRPQETSPVKRLAPQPPRIVAVHESPVKKAFRDNALENPSSSSVQKIDPPIKDPVKEELVSKTD